MANLDEPITFTEDLTLLRKFLGFHSSGLFPIYDRDVVFITIDFEGSEGFSHGINQMGVSILDTRDLSDVLTRNVIKTRFYGISTPGKSDRLNEQIKKDFTHGEASWITKQEIVSTLTDIFRQCNSRNVVLIDHGLRNELRNMKMLGFRPGSHANIIAYVDTLNLSNTIRGHVEYPNLRSLACQLGLHGIRSYEHNVYQKGRKYHNAG